MSRDSSGNYTLPTGNPVVTGTTIESTWANGTMSDIATTLTNSLDRTGKGGMTAALKVADGTVSAPGVEFNSETNTGFYRVSSGLVRWSILGVDLMAMTTGEVTISSADATAAAKPTLNLLRASASPAASDVLGEVVFQGKNAAAETVDYGSVYSTLVTTTDGAEDGEVRLATMQAGTLTDVLTLDETGLATFAGGVTITGTLTATFGALTVTELTVTNGENATDIYLFRDDATPTVADELGRLTFRGKNDADETTDYATITGYITSVTDGAESAEVIFSRLVGGALVEAFRYGPTGDIILNAGVSAASFNAEFNNVTANGTLTALGDASLGLGDILFVDESAATVSVNGALDLNGEVVETDYLITDGASVVLDPANGGFQRWTLGANRTCTESLANGESLTLHVSNAGGHTLTFPTALWVGGSAEDISGNTTGWSVFEIWQSNSNLFIAYVGNFT